MVLPTSAPTYSIYRTLSAPPEKDVDETTLKSRPSSLVKLGRMLKGSQDGDALAPSPPGVIEYAVFFEIPRDLPPSHHSASSSIIWRLTAHAKRKGAMASDFVAGTDVTVVGSEGAPPNLPINGTGVWNDALHYSITSSSSVVSLGAEWPAYITLTPMAKVKIHRVSAQIQGKFTVFHTA